MSYQHILLVTDLKADSDKVAEKTKAILNRQGDDNTNETGKNKTKLSVLHIVKDTMIGFGYELVPVASMYEVDEERCQDAKQEMVSFLQRNKLTAKSTNISAEVTTAISSAEGIISYCDTHDVDLIIIGRHERHGWSALIKGATSDNIMPDVKCDTLVVHLD